MVLRSNRRGPAHPRLASAVAVAVVVALAGCGDGPARSAGNVGAANQLYGGLVAAGPPRRSAARAVRPGATPVPTTPGALAGPGEPVASRKVRTVGGITSTPFAHYFGRVAISTRAGFLAVAVGGPNETELRVSAHGELPVKAAGAGAIPIWATIHVGTNAAGGTIVTYPRCSGDAVSSCDIYTWTAATEREAKDTAVSLPGRGETEASFDHGDAVVATSRSPNDTMDHLRFAGTGTIVRYQPRGGAARVVFRRGASGVALPGVVLSGDLIGALVSSRGGGCGFIDATVARTTGAILFKHRFYCDLADGGTPTGVAIDGGQFLFGFARIDSGSAAYGHQLDTGGYDHAELHLFLTDWAPIDRTSGYAVNGFGCDGLYEGGTPRDGCTIDRVTGIRLRRGRGPSLASAACRLACSSSISTASSSIPG